MCDVWCYRCSLPLHPRSKYEHTSKYACSWIWLSRWRWWWLLDHAVSIIPPRPDRIVHVVAHVVPVSGYAGCCNESNAIAGQPHAAHRSGTCARVSAWEYTHTYLPCMHIYIRSSRASASAAADTCIANAYITMLIRRGAKAANIDYAFSDNAFAHTHTHTHTLHWKYECVCVCAMHATFE